MTVSSPNVGVLAGSRVDILKRVPMFAALDDAELETLAGDSEERLFHPGEDIVTQGDPVGPFFVLYEGRCKVLIDGWHRRDIGPGQFFGDMAMFDGEPRSATVRADTEVRGLAISPEAFFGLLARDFGVTAKMLAHLSRRARAAERELEEFRGQGPTARF